jgi:hypothetical protein
MLVSAHRMDARTSLLNTREKILSRFIDPAMNVHDELVVDIQPDVTKSFCGNCKNFREDHETGGKCLFGPQYFRPALSKERVEAVIAALDDHTEEARKQIMNMPSTGLSGLIKSLYLSK